ncbi:MAG: glycosyltransferase family 4 protein [Nanoarchaeota archaeon]
MKNVLVLTTTFPRWKNDSTPSFVFKLSNLLTKKYNMVVLAPHAYKAAKNENMGNLKVVRFKYFFPEKYQKIAYGAGMVPNIKNSILAKLQLPGFLASQLKNAKTIIEKEKIRLVHAHWIIPQGLLGVFIKKKYNLPLIATIHGTDLFLLKNIFFKKLQEIVVDNADIITVNSRTAEEELISRFPHIKNKVKLIPMGVDTSLFKPKNIKNKFSKYKNDRIIMFAGRLNEQKGVEYLIKAMPNIRSKIKNVRLLIIGEGHYRKYLEKIRNEQNLNDYVEFLGPKSHEETARYYNLADVFVLPSVTSRIGKEAFGLVLIEAMACGTCVVGSSSGGIKDIIKDKVNGLIFEEKNFAELSKKISKLLMDDKLRERLSRNGLRFARKRYDWRIISNKFLKLYGQLAK